jgi:hypothetical protein
MMAGTSQVDRLVSSCPGNHHCSKAVTTSAFHECAGLCSTYLHKQATLHGLGGTKAGRSFVLRYTRVYSRFSNDARHARTLANPLPPLDNHSFRDPIPYLIDLPLCHNLFVLLLVPVSFVRASPSSSSPFLRSCFLPNCQFYRPPPSSLAMVFGSGYMIDLLCHLTCFLSVTFTLLDHM